MREERHGHLRLRVGGDNQIWVEQRLPQPWHGWIAAARVVPDQRGLPVLNEVRVYSADPAATGAGVPWTLIRRAVALSEHARFAHNMIASAIHLRGRLKDIRSRRLALALVVAGFSAGSVAAPAALRPPPRAGRGRPSVWTHADYARVALLYDEAVAAGQSPQQRVAEATSRPITVARNLIYKTRKLGLIPKSAKQGRWSLERLTQAQRRALSRAARGSRIKIDRT